MSRLHTLVALTTLGLCTLCVPSYAQEPEAAKAKMIQALTVWAKGECAENIVSPMLLDICEQQVAANRQILSPLGRITDARYRGMQEMPGGLKAEAYRVEFERGAMMWYASLDGGGRLLVLWSNGQVRQK